MKRGKKEILAACEAAIEIAESWTAEDGGLTMAASDLLVTAKTISGQAAQADTLPEFWEWFETWVGGFEGLFLAETGPESDLLTDVWFASHPLSLEDAWEMIRKETPGLPMDPDEAHRWVEATTTGWWLASPFHPAMTRYVPPLPPLVTDVIDRYRSAHNAGPWHDTDATVEAKNEFRDRWNICPEL